MLRWEIVVRRHNIYGDRVVSSVPASILADSRDGVTEKVRVAFNATYDKFRNFWSHDWVLISVSEVAPDTTNPERHQ